MMDNIIANEKLFTRRLREYCDSRGIICGADRRGFFDNGVCKYVFYCDRSINNGSMIMVDFKEVVDPECTLEVVFDDLYRMFCEGSYRMPNLDMRRVLIKEEIKHYNTINSKFGIKRVIFNNPATIVFWEDGTKTVVKRQKGDRWDKEKGIAMAIAKKLYGNTGKYCDILKEHLELSK